MATAVRAIDRSAVELPEAPCEAFFFDVETMDPPAAVMERLEKAFCEDWEPPKNYRDEEKIGALRLADLDKWRERAALLDAAPVAMVGLMFEDDTYILHGLKREKLRPFGRNGRENRRYLEGFKGEGELMEAVRIVLEKRVGPETRGVGHNCYGFDLGKLRLAMVRNGLTLPEAFRVLHLEDEDRQPFVDTMKLYCRYFGRSGQLFITQDAMLENLGLRSLLKGVATGAEVPALLKAGQINAVATKLLADLVGLREAFVKMTGRAK